MTRITIAIVCAVVLKCIIACDHDELFIYPEFPAYFQKVVYPDDNQPTESRVAFGEKLFSEVALSLDSTLSCQSCHKLKHALADNTPISPGINGRLGKRNTPSLYNAALLGRVNKDGGVSHIDLQAMVPIEDENEMSISILKAADRLNDNPTYVRLAKEAYDRAPDAYVITRALASYVRTLTSVDSPYDDYLQGDSLALSNAALRGMNLFHGDRLKCGSCHSGPNFTDDTFQNNGLYADYQDLGRALITQSADDIGKFRVPSLRNVALTAPYMHDGSVATLEEVIDHYAYGSRYDHPNRSTDVNGFHLSNTDKQDLISFLEVLSGDQAQEVVSDIHK